MSKTNYWESSLFWSALAAFGVHGQPAKIVLKNST